MNGKRPLYLSSAAAKFLPPTPPPPPQRRISLYHPILLPLQTHKSMRDLLQVQAQLITAGLFSDPFAASRVLKSSADVAPLDHTLLLLRHTPLPDTFCVNVALKALSRSPNPNSTTQFYFEMLASGFVPNTFTFPPLANSCARARARSPGGGCKCHAQAVKHGATNAVPVTNALLHMYAAVGLVDCARKLFDDMPCKDLVSWNSMVDGYAKVGELDSARELFDQMPIRNVVSWNTMIGGYLRERRPGSALKVFREMGEKGVRASETTMVGVATACSRLGRLRDGRSVHGYFARNFVEENLIFATALVDMYSRCGRADVAQVVFDGMSDRNRVCWNAMVVGHCIHGCPEDGIALFNKMVGRGGNSDDHTRTEPTGIVPDEVTFVGVLCACARLGRLTEGKAYFNSMTKLYSLTPTFAHYWCMANLYGGLGLVQEAEEVLKGMPEETGPSVWSHLLGLCRFRGDVELGESIAKRLIELEPSNCSRYAFLWNVYAAAGRWEDAYKVKEMMKERGVRVMPGYRLFDLKEMVHKFKLGDRSNPEIEKIHLMMDDLAATIKLTNAAPRSNTTRH